MKSQRRKWHDSARVKASKRSGGDAKIGTQHYKQLLDNEGLDVKAAKQLVVLQPMQKKLACVNQCRKGVMEAGRNGEGERRRKGMLMRQNPL